MADSLSLLRAFSWTMEDITVQFPVTEMEVGFSQDLAEHKFWGVDGAQVEATGRSPLMFSAHIPFTNHLVSGKNEDFSVLYPDVFRRFIILTSDRRTGILTHPEFGPIQCKVKDVRARFDAHVRDGVMVDATWIETLTDQTTSQFNLNPSPAIQETETFAGNLDRELSSTFLPSDPTYKPDFDAQMNAIAGVADQVSLLGQRYAGKIDNISYRLNKIDDAVTRITVPPRTTVKSIINPNPSATNKALSTLYWPVRASVNGMRSGLNDLKKKLLESGKPIVFYRVPRAATLASVTIATGAPITDIMNLNPDLLRAPYIPVGSVVRYYRNAA
jgi:hypothetical protein